MFLSPKNSWVSEKWRRTGRAGGFLEGRRLMTNEHKVSRLAGRKEKKKSEIRTPRKEDEENGNRSKGLYKGMLPCACMPMSILTGAIASL